MRDADGYLLEGQWIDGDGSHPDQTRYRTVVTAKDGETGLTVDIDLWEADYMFGGPPTRNEPWPVYLRRLALDLAIEELTSGRRRSIRCILGSGGRCHYVEYTEGE
jgi:hypothetical protein